MCLPNFKLLDSKKLGLDFNLNSSQYIKDGSDLTYGNDGIIQSALQWNPTDPLRNPDGSLNITPGARCQSYCLFRICKRQFKSYHYSWKYFTLLQIYRLA